MGRGVREKKGTVHGHKVVGSIPCRNQNSRCVVHSSKVDLNKNIHVAMVGRNPEMLVMCETEIVTKVVRGVLFLVLYLRKITLNLNLKNRCNECNL